VLAFAALCAALISMKPLIMDELLTLIAVRQPTLSGVLAATRDHAGNVPLGFLLENLSLRLTGYSVWLARLPWAVFGVATLIAFIALARKLRAPSPLLATILFAAFPQTLRYALEIRPYMPALLFSILLTLLFLKLADHPSLGLTSAYALLVAAALYTLPFAAFVTGAHFLWAAIYKKWRAATYIAIASILAVASFVPWYLSARASWHEEMTVRFIRFSINAKSPLLLFREVTGAGYWGMGVIVLLCILGAARSKMDRPILNLLLLLIAVPFAAGLLADAVFGYFLAARQFLWILPALAILAASASQTRPREATAFALIALAICGYKSARYFTQPEPDYAAAASAIAQEVDRGACFRVVPEISRQLYVYFAPQLAMDSGTCSTVVAAVVPGFSDQDRDVLFNDFAQHGYTKIRTGDVGETAITTFRKPRP
jgi:4-amino-4-deoxy-L-arabinose transferase-like glycosyltransferase